MQNKRNFRIKCSMKMLRVSRCVHESFSASKLHKAGIIYEQENTKRTLMQEDKKT